MLSLTETSTMLQQRLFLYSTLKYLQSLHGVDTGILDPRDTYADASEWEKKADDLADRFIKNFAKYEGNDAGKALVSAGPQK